MVVGQGSRRHRKRVKAPASVKRKQRKKRIAKSGSKKVRKRRSSKGTTTTKVRKRRSVKGGDGDGDGTVKTVSKKRKKKKRVVSEKNGNDGNDGKGKGKGKRKKRRVSEKQVSETSTKKKRRVSKKGSKKVSKKGSKKGSKKESKKKKDAGSKEKEKRRLKARIKDLERKLHDVEEEHMLEYDALEVEMALMEEELVSESTGTIDGDDIIIPGSYDELFPPKRSRRGRHSRGVPYDRAFYGSYGDGLGLDSDYDELDAWDRKPSRSRSKAVPRRSKRDRARSHSRWAKGWR